MGWGDLAQVMTVSWAEGSAYKPVFPPVCSVGEALASFVDLHGLPRRTSLKDWAPFAKDPAEAAALLAMAGKTPAGKARYAAEVEAKKRSLAEVLILDFPSVQVPLAHFLYHAPHLQPRYYTISSSSSAHPKRIHITVALADAPKPPGASGLSLTGERGGVVRGVCSAFLTGLEPPGTLNGSGKRGSDGDPPGDSDRKREKTGEKRPPRPWPSCRVFVRPSSFRLPADPAAPVVLIGPGTGIAPMRALLQERHHQRTVQGLPVGPSVLFFGCKHAECDFLYKAELEALQAGGTLTALHVALSRPGYLDGSGSGLGADQKKVYVQHLMAEPVRAAELWDFVDARRGSVYVCGGTSMGADVAKAFATIVAAKLGGEKAAEAYVAKLKADGRYIQELWS